MFDRPCLGDWDWSGVGELVTPFSWHWPWQIRGFSADACSLIQPSHLPNVSAIDAPAYGVLVQQSKHYYYCYSPVL